MNLSSPDSKPVRPIFCGTDFSNNSARAARVAAVFAKGSGHPLLLAHVADELSDFSQPNTVDAEVFEETMNQRLVAEVGRLTGDGVAVKGDFLTTSGHLVEHALMQRINEVGPALIVVSSVSKTSFDRWSLGSVSEHLALRAASPTLVVRSSQPFEAWAAGERTLKIFVAVDFGSVSDAALQWAGELRRIGACEIVVAYVGRPDEEWKRLGAADEVRYTENSPEVQASLERNLREKVRVVLGEDAVEVIVEPVAGRADARLIELASEHHADLVVVGTHQRPLLSRWWRPSTSLGILRHAPMSVACVPGAAFPLMERPLPEVRRILVASDFSELSIRAIQHACTMAREGATILLLHVVPPVRLPDLLPVPAAGEDPHEAADQRRRMLDELALRLRKLLPRDDLYPPEIAPSKLHFEAHVVEDDDVARAIGLAAERLGADLICIGSHGRSALASALIGSVARETMKRSRRPVLFVPPATE
ncbi:MAG TPA: universal stress protein [Chthoniobacteraceae bacterium]|nr:universal stress protein [Chthoniobacteraceae bacterium]